MILENKLKFNNILITTPKARDEVRYCDMTASGSTYILS